MFTDMVRLSGLQIETLRLIEQHGLIVPTVDLFVDGALAHLDFDPPDYQVVHVATARRLAQEGLSAPLAYTPPAGEAIIEWAITETGSRKLARPTADVR